MKGKKRFTIGVLRAIGVCVLVGILIGTLAFLEKDLSVEPAQIIFAGTKDDADCAILQSGGSCVVIDTGEAQDAEHILELLRERQIEKIDCLILTHPDKDHIGGAPALLDALPVKMVVCPYYNKENTPYRDLQEKMEALGVSQLIPSRDRVLVFGDLKLQIWPPEDFYYEKDNDYSIAVLVEHGSVNLFFAGDAQKQRLQELEQREFPDIDLYKVAYHGRDSSHSAQLIRKIGPRLAVVTAKEPLGETAEALKEVSAQVLCTLGQDYFMESNGDTLEWKRLSVSDP